MSTIVEVKYFNSFWLKKVEKVVGGAPIESQPTWPGIDWNPFGYPTFPIEGADESSPNDEADGNWYIEEARIKGGFNNTMVAQGVRAFANVENPMQDVRSSSIIYSGVYNSRTDINQTNVFSIAEEITKTLDPANGSIQKLFTEDNNLIVFQENKVNQALIDKDAIYSAEGAPIQTTSNVVIGQIIPYLGRFGIGKNPESFAQFGFRKYFVDPNRGTVMRLSRDGLTEISKSGMKDFFRDKITSLNNNYTTNNVDWSYVSGLPSPPQTINEFVVEDLDICNVFIGSKVLNLVGSSLIDTGAIILNIQALGTSPETYEITVDKPIQPELTGVFSFDYKSKIIGNWDNFNKYYTVSIQETPSFVSSTEDYYTLSFDEGVKGWVSFFSYKPSFGFSLKGKYYSTSNNGLYEHYVEIPENYGVFYGVPRESTIEFVVNIEPSLKKVFTTINYEGDNGWQVNSLSSSPTRVDLAPNEINADLSNVIYSYNEGLYTDAQGYPQRVGFDRKENLYVSSIESNSLFQNGQVLPAAVMTGIKGYYMDVILSTDQTTDPQGSKELWSVGTTFIKSS